jgi:hypothetical protein
MGEGAEGREATPVRGPEFLEIEDDRRARVSDDPEKLARFVVTFDPTVDADHSLATSVAFDIDAYGHFDSP